MATYRRMAYIGDGNFHDREAPVVFTKSNQTMSENYICSWDDAGQLCIFVAAQSKTPDYGFSHNTSNTIYPNLIYPQKYLDTVFVYGCAPAPNIDEFYVDCKDLALYGGVSTTVEVDATANSGSCVQGIISGGGCHYDISTLKQGRYLFFARVKENAVNTDDIRMNVTSTFAVGYFHQNNTYNNLRTITTPDVWEYFQTIFHVPEDDADMVIQLRKQATVALEELRFDAIYLLPLSNGVDWVQDIVYNALRSVKKEIRRFVK